MSKSASTRADAGRAELARFLASLSNAVRGLTEGELARYAGRRVVAGWRVAVQFPDALRHLDVLADVWFPRSAPRVGLVERPARLAWPHVEDDGVLCLMPEDASVACDDIVGVARHVLRQAFDLIEDCAAGRRDEDFRDEFLPYWNRGKTANASAMFSLLRPEGPSRLIRVWRGELWDAVADDEATIRRWFLHRYGEWGDRKTVAALMLWTAQALLPREYPQTGPQLHDLVRGLDAKTVRLVDRLLMDPPTEMVIVLGSQTTHGPVLAGVRVTPAPRSELLAGFRPGHAPASVLSSRYIGRGSVSRCAVDRGDPAWIHCRSGDAQLQNLQKSKVAVLGCGSLGAPVAIMLAQAGVGHLLLVDPQLLSLTNTGRHPLGATAADKFKATALASHIKSNYPTIMSADRLEASSDDVLRVSPDLLWEYDLVVSATGRWASDGLLNERHVAQGRVKPVVYGWMEAHAAAGHAVVITRSGGCLQCGFSGDGRPLLEVTKWAGDQDTREPGCGAVFQTYGPSAVSRVASLVVDLALDCLHAAPTASALRVCAAPRRQMDRLGGDWTEAWLRASKDAANGGLEVELPWPFREACSECAEGA